MNIKIKLLTLFFFPLISYGQLDKDLQPTEVYINNNIYSREEFITNSPIVSGTILVFDEDGKLKEEYLKDNYDRKKVQYKYSYLYNDKGQLIQKVDSSYYQIEVYIVICNYTYENNILNSCECKDQNGKFKSIETYENKGRKTIESLFRGDSIYRTQTTEYDSVGYKVRFYGNSRGDNTVRNFQINGKVFTIKDSDQTWDYKFVNEYVNELLVNQTRYENGEKKETEEFKYNKKGLLVAKTHSDRGADGSQEVYKYKFRKK